MHPLRAIQTFANGESYWRVKLSNGRTWSQLDTVYDPLRGQPEKKYQRSIDWYIDLVGTGDVKRIQEIWLCSPVGDVAIHITEPGTVYQFNASGLLIDISGNGINRQHDAQIIGRIDDRKNGTGVAFIWDCHTRQMYRDDQANIFNFQGWRPGIQAIGVLSFVNMGLTF